MIGTTRYASINVHLGYSYSRRDDLESIGYLLIYFVKGSLPWQGLFKGNKHVMFEQICNKKLSIEISELCSNLPSCFFDYVTYCRNLKYNDEPDYNYLLNLFYKDIVSNNYKKKYDWI